MQCYVCISLYVHTLYKKAVSGAMVSCVFLAIAAGEGEGTRDSNVRAEETEGGVEGGGVGKEEDGADREEKKSPFFNILAEWTWGQVVLLRGGGEGCSL